jgi:hypothetical protein
VIGKQATDGVRKRARAAVTSASAIADWVGSAR